MYQGPHNGATHPHVSAAHVPPPPPTLRADTRGEDSARQLGKRIAR